MVTKSIRLSEEEVKAVREYTALTGEIEASVLKRAMLLGLKELRLEQGIVDYLRESDSYNAAKVAGLPRAQFLEILIDRGISLLKEPSTLREEVAFLADALGVERLRTAVSAADSSSESR